MLKIDHIAVVAETLEEGRAFVQNALGVELQKGGEHEHFGTHNYLLSLGPEIYFEVIAINPNASDTGRAAWFGLDTFRGPPRLGNWICSADDYTAALSNAPNFTGEPVALQRDDIAWQLTVPEDGSLPYDGAFPSLIEWGRDVKHPASALPDRGVRLTKWVVSHPEASQIEPLVKLNDPRVLWSEGPAGFYAEFETPNGLKSLT